MKYIFLILALLTAPLHADQNAPELDDLFAKLQDDLQSREAAQVTREIWRAWLRHDDEEVRAVMLDGMRAMRARRWQKALTHFDEAVQLAPDFAEAWNKRATAHYQLGDFVASTADVDVTLRLEPRHFGALSGQGMMYMQERKVTLALQFFRRALDANPYMDNIRRYVEILAKIREKDVI